MALMQRALRTFNAASLTANFQAVGAVIPFAVWEVAFINPSAVDFLITDLSAQNDIRVPANGTLNIVGINYGGSRAPSFVFAANTILQIKQATAAGTGTIIINLFG
jgi:hypothetical protein